MLKIGHEKIYTQMEIFENVRAYGKAIITACPGLAERDVATILAVAMGEDVDFVQGRIGNALRLK